MDDADLLAENVNTVMLATGKVLILPDIEKQYMLLNGHNLRDKVTKCGFGTVEQFLSRFPSLFSKFGNAWKAIPKQEVSHVLHVMAAGKNKNNKFRGNQRRGGNIGIERVKRGIQMYPPVYNNPERRRAFTGIRRKSRSTSFSPSGDRGYREGEDLGRTNFDDDNRGFRNREYAGSSYYSEMSYNSRNHEFEPRRYGNIRSDYVDQSYDTRSRYSFRTLSPERDVGESEYDNMYVNRREDSENRKERSRSKSRIRDKSLTRKERFVDLNEVAKKFGSVSITPTMQKISRTIVADKIVKVLETYKGGLIFADDLIKIVEDELQTYIPTEEYGGSIGVIEHIKTKRPQLMSSVVIDSNKKMVSLLGKKSGGNVKKTDMEKIEEIDIIFPQIDRIVQRDTPILEVVDRITINDYTVYDKKTLIIMAILMDSEKRLEISSVDDRAIIRRVKPYRPDSESVSSSGRSTTSDTIRRVKTFMGGEHLIRRKMEEDLPKMMEVRITKFKDFSSPFFVMLEGDVEEFDDMNSRIQEVGTRYSRENYESIPINMWKINDGCLISETSKINSSVTWKRAVVTFVDLKEELLYLYLLDYGQTKCNPYDTVFPMPSSFISISPFALECSLPKFEIIDGSEDDFDTTVERLTEVITESNAILAITPIRMTRQHMEVSLLIQKKNKTWMDFIEDFVKKQLIRY